MALLDVDDLRAGYGSLQVLYGVTFSLSKGELLAIVGPNGSGKSTLLKAITGLATLHGGRVLLDGEDITSLKPHEKARRGLVYVPQVGSVFEKLTVRENLMMAGYTLDEEELWRRVREVLEILPRLRGMMGRKAWTLSGGERQMLALAMALVREPKLLMLDEPTANLAPKIAKSLMKVVVDVRDSMNIGVVLVEQNASMALEVCDRALLLVSGRQVYLGPPSDLLSRKDLASVYLGVEGK